MKRVTCIFLCSISISAIAETYTQAREISEIELKQYSSSSSELTYFNIYSATGSWDPSGCALQSVVQFKSTDTIGYEQFLSMALAAKMGQKKVSFNGECTSDTLFSATNIKIW